MSSPESSAPGVPTCYRHPGREAHIRCQRCERPICPDCMNPAAVGFQCPECVAEGRKTQRVARTAYGGLRPTDASITTGVLIGINAVIWLLITATGGNGSRLVDLLALRPNGICTAGGFILNSDQALCVGDGTWRPGFADGAYWQVVTAGFTHVSILHIAFNMYALWIIGPQLESVLGRTRFLALYFLALLGGSALVLWAGNEYQASLGASGAVYGLFAALLLIARKVGSDTRQLLIVIAINVAITFTIPHISWQAHVGGFLGGAAATALLVYAPRGPRRTPFQVAGLSGLAVVIAVAIVARLAVLA